MTDLRFDVVVRPDFPDSAQSIIFPWFAAVIVNADRWTEITAIPNLVRVLNHELIHVADPAIPEEAVLWVEDHLAEGKA